MGASGHAELCERRLFRAATLIQITNQRNARSYWLSLWENERDVGLRILRALAAVACLRRINRGERGFT